MYDIIIIGAGTAGLTAAIYGQRAGLSCKIFEKYAPGGQIVNSPSIENYPGMYGVSGYEYSMALLEQAQKCGAEIEFAEVTGAELLGETKKVITTAGEFEAKAVIIANGAARRKIGCKGEDEFEGRGVSIAPPATEHSSAEKPLPLLAAEKAPLKKPNTLQKFAIRYILSTAATFSAPQKPQWIPCSKRKTSPCSPIP